MTGRLKWTLVDVSGGCLPPRSRYLAASYDVDLSTRPDAAGALTGLSSRGEAKDRDHANF